MSHGNARLTFHGRCLLVKRVRDEGWTIAQAAKSMGISRQCGSRWLTRFDSEGHDGLYDRSSRPHNTPTRTTPAVEALVLQARAEQRRGPDWLAPHVGVPARTITRILRRHNVPRLCLCDPMTGEVIRSSKATAIRYERARPGELVHMDVKKIARIPDTGGWRVHGRAKTSAEVKRRNGTDYIHSLVDDHSRLAYSEILDDEKAPTCAQFLERATAYFAAHGITRIERVMTDNAWSYRRGLDLRDLLARLGATHKFIKPYCPWQNGKVERFNRTLQEEWIYRQPFTSNDERSQALAPWLESYNTERRHSSLGGKPPISRLTSPT